MGNFLHVDSKRLNHVQISVSCPTFEHQHLSPPQVSFYPNEIHSSDKCYQAWKVKLGNLQVFPNINVLEQTFLISFQVCYLFCLPKESSL